MGRAWRIASQYCDALDRTGPPTVLAADRAHDHRRRCAALWRAGASQRDRQWRAISCSASATISQRCARTPWLKRHSLVPSKDPGRLVQRLQRPLPVCDGFMPGTECLRRTGNFYRGIAFADFPAERASWRAAPARDQPKWRRLIHACFHACIQGLHCTTGTRREKGMSMALDFKLLHYRSAPTVTGTVPAAVAATAPPLPPPEPPPLHSSVGPLMA